MDPLTKMIELMKCQTYDKSKMRRRALLLYWTFRDNMSSLSLADKTAEYHEILSRGHLRGSAWHLILARIFGNLRTQCPNHPWRPLGNSPVLGNQNKRRTFSLFLHRETGRWIPRSHQANYLWTKQWLMGRNPFLSADKDMAFLCERFICDPAPPKVPSPRKVPLWSGTNSAGSIR